MAVLEIDGAKVIGSLESLDNLARLAAEVPDDQLVVELGVFQGGSLRALSEAHEPTVGIDLFGRDLPYAYAQESWVYTDTLEIARQHAPKAQILRYDTAQAAYDYEWAPVGLLHIDGDHTYQGVQKDFHAWLPHLVSGCLVVFDDYRYRGDRFPGVTRFVQENWGDVPQVAGRQAVVRV